MQHHKVDLIVKPGADGTSKIGYLMFEKLGGFSGGGKNKEKMVLTVNRKTGISTVRQARQPGPQQPIASFAGTQSFLSDIRHISHLKVMDVARQMAFDCQIEDSP